MPQRDPDRAIRCPLRFHLEDDHCIERDCRWWIDYGQDDGGCAMVWIGECVEAHVQRFCNELSAITREIGQVRKEIARTGKAALKARETAAREEQ